METRSIGISNYVEIELEDLRTYNHQSLWKYQGDYTETPPGSYFNYILLES